MSQHSAGCCGMMQRPVQHAWCMPHWLPYACHMSAKSIVHQWPTTGCLPVPTELQACITRERRTRLHPQHTDANFQLDHRHSLLLHTGEQATHRPVPASHYGSPARC